MSTHHDFFSIFPIPTFLEIKPFGIDISDGAIRCMQLHKGPKGFVPVSFGEYPLSNGSSVSTNKDEIKKALEALKQKHKISFARISLPEEKGYLYKTEIPKVSYLEMNEAVGYTIEENAPVSLAEVVYDYNILEGASQRDKITVTVSVLPKIVVDEYIELFESVDITPISFEIEPQATARAIIPFGNNHTHMVIQVGNTRTGIAVVSSGVVQYASTVPVGGMMLTNALQSALNIDIDEAKRIKSEEDYITNPHHQIINKSFLEVLILLKEEINKHFIYWSTHQPAGSVLQKIDTIYISGNDVCTPGFMDYMHRNLKAEVKVANVWTNCFSLDDYVPSLEQCDAFSYACAIGLVLPK